MPHMSTDSEGEESPVDRQTDESDAGGKDYNYDCKIEKIVNSGRGMFRGVCSTFPWFSEYCDLDSFTTGTRIPCEVGRSS